MSDVWKWLQAQDEESIIAWANKGLLRRGQKTLDASPPQLHLEADRASAQIDGFTQQLNGAGFNHLTCTCPTPGPCHHLCALLLALKSAAPTQVAELSPAEPYWLSLPMAQLEAMFSAAAMKKAQVLMSQAVPVELQLQANALLARIQNLEEISVRLPLIGGIDDSTCSCRKSLCAHRALVILHARAEAGLDTPALAPPTLSEAAINQLTKLQHWILSLVMQGWGNTGPAFLDQGEALATELKQAQMPRVSVLVRQIVGLARSSRRHNGEQFQPTLNSLWVLMSGLQQPQFPRPLKELTGSHRRTYRTVQSLTLQCAGVELWQTDSGFHGFSVYFWTPERAEFVIWSQARPIESDLEWEPADALKQASLGGVKLANLIQAPCKLLLGWLSADNRLSSRDETRLTAYSGRSASIPVCALETIQSRWAKKISVDPWQLLNPEPERIKVTSQTPVQKLPGTQTWFLYLWDGSGCRLRVEGDLKGPQKQAFEQLSASPQIPIDEIFGVIHCNQGELVMRPVALHWRDDPRLYHLTAPQLKAANLEA